MPLIEKQLQKYKNQHKKTHKRTKGSDEEVIKYTNSLELIYSLIIGFCLTIFFAINGHINLIKSPVSIYSSDPEWLFMVLRIVLCFFLLTRFFYAPTRVIKPLFDNFRIKKGSIFTCHIPIMLMHSFVISFLIGYLLINNIDKYLEYVLLLLIGNALWLFWIKLFGRTCEYDYWIYNNSFFAVVFFIISKLTAIKVIGDYYGVIVVCLLLLNSFIDLSKATLYGIDC